VTRANWRTDVRPLVDFGRPYRSLLLGGSLAAVAVVLVRLAMPWPLSGVVEWLFPARHGESGLLLSLVPGWADPVLFFAGSYLLLGIALGISELIQRVRMKKFAAHTVHDLRAEAIRGAAHRAGAGPRGSVGDLLARVIGDTARIKADLAGILVHGTQNSFLFLAVCAVLLVLSPKLGWIFVLAGLLVILTGFIAALPVASAAYKHRRKEGHVAAAIHGAWERGRGDWLASPLNAASARKDVEITRLIALSSLVAHTLLAGTVGLGLWVGAGEVQAGRLGSGELFLFIAYSLTIHRRLVQVGRQLARSGKLRASVRRVGELIEVRDRKSEVGGRKPAVGNQESGVSTGGAPALPGSVRLEGVVLKSLLGKRAKPRLRQTDLIVTPGSRVAVLGKLGAGKSSLLRVLARIEAPSKGAVCYEETDAIAYLPPEVALVRQRVSDLLGLIGPAPAPTAQQLEVLERAGIWRIVGRFPKGLSQKVSSATLSAAEAKALALGRILLGNEPIWILDDPVDLPSKQARQRVLGAILEASRGRTLVVALTRSALLECFDRVLYMKKGGIAFDGTPAEWEERRHARSDPGSGAG
jgi:ABC-type multidrug transport system fused ATPase/permease subunit